MAYPDNERKRSLETLRSTISRRTLLKGAASTALFAPAIIGVGRARAAGQVVVRTPGGAYETAIKAAIYEPFTQETGIEVVTVPANIAKLLAMFKSGNVE